VVNVAPPSRLESVYAYKAVPPPCMQALQQRAEELSADLSDQQKKELAEAFEKLGYSDLAAKASP
jgi:hypothetical protein